MGHLLIEAMEAVNEEELVPLEPEGICLLLPLSRFEVVARDLDCLVVDERGEVANEVKSRDYSIPLHKAEMSPATDLNTDSAHTTVFRIVNAIGGSIIETRRYDPKTERNSTNLYIVNDGEDLTESLGKVMTMEALR